MEYYERERIIAECRKKLPYPISFYDKLNDGSLWNVYNKHVVNGIPIDKRGRRAKADNDQARAIEAQQKADKAIDEAKKAQAVADKARQTAERSKKKVEEPAYEQMDLFTWSEQLQKERELEAQMEPTEPTKPRIVYSEDGSWWRLNDAGEYDWIPDSELNDVLEAFGIQRMIPEEEGYQLTLRPKRR